MPNKIWRFNSTQVLKKSRRTATDKGNKLEENFRVFELRGGSVVEAAKDRGGAKEASHCLDFNEHGHT